MYPIEHSPVRPLRFFVTWGSRACLLPKNESVNCNQALATPDSAALDQVIAELKVAIAEHIRHMRMRAAEDVPRLFGSGNNLAD